MKQPTNEDDYDAFMATVDELAMGRGSYETVLSFETWPYEKPVVVLARTMGDADVPNHLKGCVRITDAMPLCVMDGPATDELISNITIVHVPIFLGNGRPLFGALQNDIDLKHLGTTAYAPGMVHSKYEVMRPADGAA